MERINAENLDRTRLKVLFFANTDWYLYNFRRSLAKSLIDAGHEVILVSPSGPYGWHLQKLGFRWIEAPMHRRSLNPLREMALLNWLRALLVREQVDLVHGFTIKCAVYGSLAARMAGIPRVSAVAGMGYVFTSGEMLARTLRPVVSRLLRYALSGKGSRLILQNPDDVQFFSSFGLVEPERIRLIPGSGVDCARFQPSIAGRAAHGARFRVLFPARLLWDKGLAEYVAAARELRGRGSTAEFLIAGGIDKGNPATAEEAQVRGWVADGTIHWLGHVEDMPGLLQSVDAVVLPSYREGLPRGLIEAAACALPLVTTDVPGCRDVVTDGVDGLLVAARDSAALANAIARLEHDRSLRDRLGGEARRKALECFDERLIVQRTLAVYSELVPGTAAAASTAPTA